MVTQKYRLKKDYPGHKIGDIAVYNSNISTMNFYWEALLGDTNSNEFLFIPVQFQPDTTPDWFDNVGDPVAYTTGTYPLYPGDEVFFATLVGKKWTWGTTIVTPNVKIIYPDSLFFLTLREATAFCDIKNAEIENSGVMVDGKKFYPGDTVWYVNTRMWGIGYQDVMPETKKFPEGLETKWFRSEERAKEYIFQNKPIFSLKDVIDSNSSRYHINLSESNMGKFTAFARDKFNK